MAKDLNLGYQEQLKLAVRAGFELRASELFFQSSNHSATLTPPYYWGISFLGPAPNIFSNCGEKCHLFISEFHYWNTGVHLSVLSVNT